MNKYHKIKTVYKRDPDTNYKTLMESTFALPEFEYLKDNIWEFQEKVDGTNIRIQWKDNKIKFAGKSDRAQIPGQLINRLNEDILPLKNKFIEIFNDADVCLYGEGYGPKIQKGGGNYRDDQNFVLFDIKIGPWWLKRKDVEEIGKKLNIDVVPVIGKGTLEDLTRLVRLGFNSKWGNFLAEGIVARPATPLIARNGRRIITKLKHKDFKETK